MRCFSPSAPRAILLKEPMQVAGIVTGVKEVMSGHKKAVICGNLALLKSAYPYRHVLRPSTSHGRDDGELPGCGNTAR
jgi:hypothetical protein